MSSPHPTLDTLFAIPTPRTKLNQAEAANPEPSVTPTVRPATYTAVTTRQADTKDPHAYLVTLCVDCPYCEATHLHPGGTTKRPLRGIRRARCIGHPTQGQHYDLRGQNQ